MTDKILDFGMGSKWQDLYDLVHSMSASEKGYFKKFNTGYSGAGSILYQQLFDTLAGMTKMDERLIEKKITSKVQHVHSVRGFLEKQILKSLRAYHAGKNMAFEVREMLDEISILNEKSLHKKSIPLIEKGLTITEQHGMYSYQMMFLIEKRQLLKFYDEHERKMQGEYITRKFMEIARSILQIELIKDAHQKSLFWVNTFIPLRDVRIRDEATQMLDDLLKADESSLKDFNEVNFLNAAISNIYFLFNKLPEAAAYQLKTVQLLETVDLKKINRQLGYASALYNLCTLYMHLSDIHGVEECLDKLRHIETENPVEIKYIEALKMFARIALMKKSNVPYDPLSAEAMETFLKQSHPIPVLYYDAQFSMLTWYIKHERWHEALHKADFLLSAENQHSQKSIHVHARLLHMLIHYKLGNTLLLTALIRHTYRFMVRQELDYTIERQILGFFKRVLSAADKQGLNRLLLDLKNKIGETRRDEQEARVLLYYFNYFGWLEHELTAGKQQQSN